VAVGAVAVLGPGLDGWDAARAILRGRERYVASPCAPPPPRCLPPTERRRTTATIRLAIAAAEAALSAAGQPEVARLASVFTSANGDGAVIDSILTALAGSPGMVSPTQFHNSVHNSPPAYWAVGARSYGASTSLGCWDASFAAGLLHAAAKAVAHRQPVLLCAYDLPFPEPLAQVRPVTEPFAVAMVLTPAPEGFSLAELDIRFVAAAPARAALPHLAALCPLCDANPAARSLPLLEALARREAATLALDYPDDGHLMIGIRPC